MNDTNLVVDREEAEITMQKILTMHDELCFATRECTEDKKSKFLHEYGCRSKGI